MLKYMLVHTFFNFPQDRPPVAGANARKTAWVLAIVARIRVPILIQEDSLTTTAMHPEAGGPADDIEKHWNT